MPVGNTRIHQHSGTYRHWERIGCLKSYVITSYSIHYTKLYDATPLEFPPEGTVDSVASVTLDDVKSFLSKHLVQERLIFVIGGDMTLDAAKSAARDILGVLPHGTSDAVQTIPVSAKVSQSVLKRPTEQAYIYFGSPYHMAVDDAENYKARVATYILGAGGFGSRLMEEIRVKRGLAYSAYARLSINRSHSVFKGYLQTKNESLEEAQSYNFV